MKERTVDWNVNFRGQICNNYNLFKATLFCALCLHQVCVVAHADHAITRFKKNGFDSKTAHFALFVRFLANQIIYFFNSHCHLNLIYPYYASSWNMQRACWNVIFSVFSPDWESSDTMQAKINSQIFAKQMNQSSVTLFKYPLKKVLAKLKSAR